MPDKRNDYNASPSSVRCQVGLSKRFAENLYERYEQECILKISFDPDAFVLDNAEKQPVDRMRLLGESAQQR